MNKSVIGIIIALLAVGGIAGLLVLSNNKEPITSTPDQSSSADQASRPVASTSEPDTPAAGDSVEATLVTIENFAYNPQSIKVKVGTKVTWTNKDSDRHDITPNTETDEFKASELLAKDESYSVTFSTPGTYSYYCSPHPYMKATVEVVE